MKLFLGNLETLFRKILKILAVPGVGVFDMEAEITFWKCSVLWHWMWLFRAVV